jgi:gamma-glutamylcyclotransferase (GGCT)/AIG2-like uncharacterized protein YtfP
MKVFVYGSLMSGYPANRLFANCKLLGKAAVRGRMINVGAYPGIIPPKEHDDYVFGELYDDVSRDTLAELDRYEGYSHTLDAETCYQRRHCPVLLFTEDSVESTHAHVYLWNTKKYSENYPVIPDGHW